jgi:hypothetical protein
LAGAEITAIIGKNGAHTAGRTNPEGNMAKDEREALVESIKSMESIIRNLEDASEGKDKGMFGAAMTSRLRDARQTLRERKMALKRFDEKNAGKK